MRPRATLFLLAICACALLATPHAIAQSQGVGLTVQAPGPSATASPSATAPAGSSTAPTGSSGNDDGAVVQGTAVTPGVGDSTRPLPRTGMDVLRLVAVALGLVTAGDLLLRVARRGSPGIGVPPGPLGR